MTDCGDNAKEDKQTRVTGDVTSPDYDASFLHDIADIVKNKTLFFIPFFGAYLAFLFAKSDYIKEANFVIWIFLGAIFLAGVRYIHLVSQLLWAAESSRLALRFRQLGYALTTEEEKKALQDVMALIPKMVAAEDWWFRRIMFLMYIGTFTVLIDIFLGKYISTHLLALESAWLE
jgi:hypothetical protein